jgi:hypothetical protein
MTTKKKALKSDKMDWAEKVIAKREAAYKKARLAAYKNGEKLYEASDEQIEGSRGDY